MLQCKRNNEPVALGFCSIFNYSFFFFFFALHSFPSKVKLKVLLVLWNLSKNRGHECHLLSLETYGSRRKGDSAWPFTSFAISQAGIEMEGPVPARRQGSSRGGALGQGLEQGMC